MDIEDLTDTLDTMAIGADIEESFKVCIKVFYQNMLDEPAKFGQFTPIVKELLDMFEKNDTWDSGMDDLAKRIN